MTNVTKLNATNYIMWSRQVHALFDGYELAHFLDGSKPSPDPTITINGSATDNPAHALHKRQDKLLYSAILGAISLSIQPILSKATTTTEIWDTLASTYAKPSPGHIKQLKHQLKQWRKGTKTVDEYLQGLITRFDQLALLGKVIDLEDQIEFVLEGLPEDYKSVIDQVEGRDAPPTLTELHEKLINHEAKLITSEPAQSLPVSANVVTNRFKPHHKNNNRNQSWQQQTNTNNTTWQPRPYLGKCQICGVQGHSARRCPQLSRQNTGVLPSPQPWQPRANYLASGSQVTPPWLLDSGATHHVTSDLANLALHQPYTGGEEVIIGDGNGLAITNTGSTF
ncbi:unnamed protein product [Microthlaspi erraticum]|uniref:CCHC-type domain-containing protein n=1 Tax=Microthlaspi erraticum TaxID=1685480 RepID=A0A6D2JCS0_9BRAS|nr:unnamed protein product [Microthlaspi erraticum]